MTSRTREFIGEVSVEFMGILPAAAVVAATVEGHHHWDQATFDSKKGSRDRKVLHSERHSLYTEKLVILVDLALPDQ